MRLPVHLPVLFPPVKIGKRYYLDGGVADSVPYRRAFEKGCDKVIVILTRSRDYIKKQEKSFRLAQKLYRDYPAFIKTLKNRPQSYNRRLQDLYRAEREGRVFVLAPEDTLGIGRTESSPQKLRALYEEGYYQAKESMHALHLYLQK